MTTQPSVGPDQTITPGPNQIDIPRLGRGRLKPKYGGWTETHPDTGAVIPGQVLPFWGEVRKLALDAARATPGLRSVGWDILIFPTGPVLVEANCRWDLQFVQVFHGGIIGTDVGDAWKILGVDLPDGSREWVRRHTTPLPTRVARRARRIAGRRG